MKASDYVVNFLETQGVTHVFELVGGMITHLVDSLHKNDNIQVVSVHHEQGASFAADAFGRVTGVPGVAMATSGPGATNLLTGMGSCYFDSSPAVFITGQVNCHELKGDRAIRQLGFQETDIVKMAAPITKAVWLVEDAADLPRILTEAFELAVSGRPGPVLIDIPMDVQRNDVTAPLPTGRLMPIPTPAVPPQGLSEIEAVKACFDDLLKAERPLILVGGGIHSAQALPLFRVLADKLNIPVVNSLMAVDALPYHHPLRVGLIGSYGNRWANLAIGESDFMLVLGSRLDVRQTGADTVGFKSERTIYHVDCEPGEINNRVVDCHAIISDLKPFLTLANALAEDFTFPECTDWVNRIESLRASWPDTEELKDVPGINPNIFMHALSSVCEQTTAYVVDVGQHQMWAAQSLTLHANQHFLTSGGMGAMGFALPAAIGATLGCERQPVVMIAGDGSFQLNIQELQTVARNRLPIKMVVINNQCHGMVRQFQESYFDKRYQSTLWGYSAPDFAQIAAAYGIASATLEDPQETESALSRLWQDPEEPYVLQVMVGTGVNVYPKLAYGHPITEMEPFAKPLEMEGT